MPKKDPQQIEAIKFVSDFFKHLTTIATGSILLIATLLDKIFTHPQWKFAVIIALSAFLLCVLGCILAMFSYSVMSSEWGEHDPDKFFSPFAMQLLLIGSLFALGGFLVGIISFTTFTIRNIVEFAP